ncbi:hypothetical protein Gotur_000323 [Gossypium turneri]
MVPGFRVRIIPVLGTIPAIFGQVMASYVVTQLAGLDVQIVPVHQRFLEDLRLYGRGWCQIEEDVGTKSAIQIRSHAQKFFSDSFHYKISLIK